MALPFGQVIGGASLASTMARAQAIYFLITGIWPLVHIRSFERITGPKADRWLVQTVGVLVAVIGGVLLLAERRQRLLSPEIGLLATGSAAGLASIDAVHVLRGRIAPVYLLDALAEAGLIAGWVAAWRSRRLPEQEGAA